MNETIKSRFKSSYCAGHDDIAKHFFTASDFHQISPGNLRKWKLRCKKCYASVDLIATREVNNHEINHDDYE